VRYGYSLLIFAVGLAAGSVQAQGVIEGTIHCEIHERMRGTILVLETPHFQNTDTSGRFRLEHLPAGKYVLQAWVAGDDVRERPVELKAGMALHVDFPAR